MSELEQHRRDWEQLAKLDAMWAVVADPQRRFGRWDADAFFATGEREADAALARGRALGLPARHGDALEFGCGLGRVTRALAARYERAVGVDIAAEMLAQARTLNAEVPNLELVHNTAPDLRILGERRFDLVYSRHVLQHLPSRASVQGYLQEMVRLLRPGGLLLVHLPLRIPLRHRLLVTRRAYTALRRLGVPSELLYRRLHLHPISMQAVGEEQLRGWIAAAGGRVVAVDTKQGTVLSGDVYATRDA